MLPRLGGKLNRITATFFSGFGVCRRRTRLAMRRAAIASSPLLGMNFSCVIVGPPKMTGSAIPSSFWEGDIHCHLHWSQTHVVLLPIFHPLEGEGDHVHVGHIELLQGGDSFVRSGAGGAADEGEADAVD
jgi:hypothetical protein